MSRAVRRHGVRPRPATRAARRLCLSAALAAVALLPLTGAVAQVPAHHPVPGGIAIVPLMSTDVPRPDARFGNRRVIVSQHAGLWVAVVGLAADMPPGDFIITVKPARGPTESRRFTVVPDRSAARYQPPDDSHPHHATRTYQQLGAWRKADRVDLRLQAPVSGFTSMRYTVRATPSPEVSLEYTLPPGTGVHAPAAGIVTRLTAEVGEPTTVVDHGRGLVSLLTFRNTVTAASGHAVGRGDSLGTVTANADQTAARLRWIVLLNGAAVNPLLLTGGAGG